MIVPFDLTNPPAEFQHFIENCLLDFRDKFPFPYLYDVIIFSSRFEAHLQHLQIVFRWFREKKYKVSRGKCKFFQGQVSFLGQVISEDGYKTDEKNISADIYLSQTPTKST